MKKFNGRITIDISADFDDERFEERLKKILSYSGENKPKKMTFEMFWENYARYEYKDLIEENSIAQHLPELQNISYVKTQYTYMMGNITIWAKYIAQKVYNQYMGGEVISED